MAGLNDVLERIIVVSLRADAIMLKCWPQVSRWARGMVLKVFPLVLRERLVDKLCGDVEMFYRYLEWGIVDNKRLSDWYPMLIFHPALNIHVSVGRSYIVGYSYSLVIVAGVHRVVFDMSSRGWLRLSYMDTQQSYDVILRLFPAISKRMT